MRNRPKLRYLAAVGVLTFANEAGAQSQADFLSRIKVTLQTDATSGEVIDRWYAHYNQNFTLAALKDERAAAQRNDGGFGTLGAFQDKLATFTFGLQPTNFAGDLVADARTDTSTIYGGGDFSAANDSRGSPALSLADATMTLSHDGTNGAGGTGSTSERFVNENTLTQLLANQTARFNAAGEVVSETAAPPSGAGALPQNSVGPNPFAGSSPATYGFNGPTATQNAIGPAVTAPAASAPITPNLSARPIPVGRASALKAASPIVSQSSSPPTGSLSTLTGLPQSAVGAIPPDANDTAAIPLSSSANPEHPVTPSTATASATKNPASNSPDNSQPSLQDIGAVDATNFQPGQKLPDDFLSGAQAIIGPHAFGHPEIKASILKAPGPSDGEACMDKLQLLLNAMSKANRAKTLAYLTNPDGADFKNFKIGQPGSSEIPTAALSSETQKQIEKIVEQSQYVSSVTEHQYPACVLLKKIVVNQGHVDPTKYSVNESMIAGAGHGKCTAQFEDMPGLSTQHDKLSLELVDSIYNRVSGAVNKVGDPTACANLGMKLDTQLGRYLCVIQLAKAATAKGAGTTALDQLVACDEKDNIAQQQHSFRAFVDRAEGLLRPLAVKCGLAEAQKMNGKDFQEKTWLEVQALKYTLAATGNLEAATELQGDGVDARLRRQFLMPSKSTTTQKSSFCISVEARYLFYLALQLSDKHENGQAYYATADTPKNAGAGAHFATEMQKGQNH